VGERPASRSGTVFGGSRRPCVEPSMIPARRGTRAYSLDFDRVPAALRRFRPCATLIHAVDPAGPGKPAGGRQPRRGSLAAERTPGGFLRDRHRRLAAVLRSGARAAPWLAESRGAKAGGRRCSTAATGAARNPAAARPAASLARPAGARLGRRRRSPSGRHRTRSERNATRRSPCSMGRPATPGPW
jgi:hypothetical protein